MWIRIIMFVYKKWVYFCKELQKSGYTSIPACDLIEQKNQNSTFIVLEARRRDKCQKSI